MRWVSHRPGHRDHRHRPAGLHHHRPRPISSSRYSPDDPPQVTAITPVLIGAKPLLGADTWGKVIRPRMIGTLLESTANAAAGLHAPARRSPLGRSAQPPGADCTAP